MQHLQSKWKPEDGSWVRVAQALIGLFFCGAAFFKFHNYFVPGDQSLAAHFQYWLDNGWAVQWFAWLVTEIGQPYHKQVAALVILCQAVPGFLLAINIRVRESAFILLAIQSLVFVGTFHHSNFNEFVGISVWVALFYLLKPKKTEDISKFLWNAFTLLFFLLVLLQVSNRYKFYSDHLLSTFALQREHLAADVMSVHPAIKYFTLWFSSLPFAKYIWTATWYVHLIAALLILTRWRLQAMIVNLFIWIFATVLWTTGITSQGVLWVLVIFMYVTMEQYLQYKYPELKKESLLRYCTIECRKLLTASW